MSVSGADIIIASQVATFELFELGPAYRLSPQVKLYVHLSLGYDFLSIVFDLFVFDVLINTRALFNKLLYE